MYEETFESASHMSTGSCRRFWQVLGRVVAQVSGVVPTLPVIVLPVMAARPFVAALSDAMLNVPSAALWDRNALPLYASTNHS